MKRLIAPKAIKLGIFRCLKAGVNPEFPEQGTCQGGVVSPLLANVALNGIEKIGQFRNNGKFAFKCVRYADDLVYFLKPEDNATQILDDIKEFLAQRGMEINESKTKITAATDGFEFLGWYVKVQNNGKFRSYPSEDNYKTFRKKVKDIINSSNYGATIKTKKLAPVVRGWRNYHRFCKMDGSKNSLFFLQKKAFKVFNKEQKQNRYSSKKLLKQAFPTVPYSENKFVNVKEDKSPYDGDLVYWSQRNSKLYDNYTSKALKRQNHSCAACGHKLTSEEKVHLHHLDENHDNWKWDNLVAIHQSCHDYQHMSKKQ
jgi:RNA-directed DNA polymerase